jgi:hypothetical protein
MLGIVQRPTVKRTRCRTRARAHELEFARLDMSSPWRVESRISLFARIRLGICSGFRVWGLGWEFVQGYARRGESDLPLSLCTIPIPPLETANGADHPAGAGGQGL